MTGTSPATHVVSQRKILLMVASSPSDLTETESTARALVAMGHEVTLAYFYAGSSAHLHRSSLSKLSGMDSSDRGLITVAVDVDESQHAKEKVIRKISARAGVDTASPVSTWSGQVRRWIAKWQIGVVFNTVVVRLRTWMDNNGSLAVYHAYLNLIRRVRQSVGLFLTQHVPTLYSVLAAWQLLKIYRSYRSIFGVLLDQRPYQAILVPEDVVGPFWPNLIHVGLQRHVPTVILPYTLANQEEAFKSLRTYPAVQTRYNRLAAYFFPNWRMKQDGYDIVRMPAGHVLAHQWLRIAPPDPWMMNSGQAQRICVDSQASYDYFFKAGIPREKLTVTGSHSQDQLAHLLKNKTAGLQALLTELALTDSKPMLLLSGCPNQLAGKVPKCEFATMREVATHVGQVLKCLANDYHLVVRPHPNYLEFAEFLKAHGVVTTLRPTSEVVPLCDLFIAFASATIRWASACGIPVINYDIFNYGYGDFAASKGVITVSTATEFSTLVADMKPESAGYRETRSRAQVDAAYWSVMDGQGLQRIDEVINQVRC